MHLIAEIIVKNLSPEMIWLTLVDFVVIVAIFAVAILTLVAFVPA